MGGSGGGGGFFYGRPDPNELVQSVRAAEQSDDIQEFNTQVSSLLSDGLAQFNDRDVEGTQQILAKVQQELSNEFEDSVGLLFGGSVAKHTYVDGLSDVDALVILKAEIIDGESPDKLVSIFAEKLRARFGRDSETVKEGRLAVTLNMDGKSIQLLPAMRTSEQFKIASPDGQTWATINPRRFAEKLTATNQTLDGKLVPVIKLVKSINGTLPEQRQLTGYHIESLAINVLKAYDGPRTTKDMLMYFFAKAPEQCKTPIRDSTGQSIHVDEYLGEANSVQRLILADALSRIGRRLMNADGARSLDEWKSVIGLE